MTVDGELAEAVADVFRRFAPGGVALEQITDINDSIETPQPNGEVIKVACYLPADEQLEIIRRRLEESLWYLSRIQPLPQLSYRQVHEDDWADAWKRHFKPVTIGQRLIIVPAWMEVENTERLQIKMDPGMAFGTGTHPSTQMCLEFIEEILESGQDRPDGGWKVIDIGGGSGILSVAALKLGTDYALCVDIDTTAISAASENAELNQVEEGMEVGQGSLDEIRSGAFGILKGHIVVVNILAAVLVELLDQGLKDLLEETGYLILSGIIQEQIPAVEAAAKRQGMCVVQQKCIGDWAALVLSRFED